MRNSVKILRPKANSLVDLPAFLQFEDVAKNQTLGNSISELMEMGSFPPPVQKFFEIPKFKELVERLKEGSLDGASLQSKEIHSLQLLLESFHKLVHLDYDFEEIEHPVVQSKVLEQNIQDYLACIDLFFPYDGKIIHEILSELFQSVHFFTGKLKATIIENSTFFSQTLISFMGSPVILLLEHLDKTNYPQFQMTDWYHVAIELNVDAKLIAKKHELVSLAKGNGHKLLNHLQTILSDMSRIYLKTPPEEVTESIKEMILSSLREMPSDQKITGQKVNELFYLEFWKEPYALLLTKEQGTLGKLSSLTHQLKPLQMSLYTLISDYGFVLPDTFTRYILEIVQPTEFVLSVLGGPNLIGAELAIGFYNTQYEYLNEVLSSDDHKKINDSCKERIELLVPTLLAFLETYLSAKPLTFFHILKERLENLYVGEATFQEYSIEDVFLEIERVCSSHISKQPSPLPLLEAYHNKITSTLRLILKEIDPETIEYRILNEKLFSFDQIDLPSYSQSWHTIGELLGVIFVFLSAHTKELKNLFSPTFFQTVFGNISDV